jgi:hypothetical protein
VVNPEIEGSIIHSLPLYPQNNVASNQYLFIFGIRKTSSMSNSDLQKKLRLFPRLSALVVNSPPEYKELLGNINVDTESDSKNPEKYDFIQIFGSQRSILEQLVTKYSVSGKYDCLFWVCYPKGGGKIKSDLNRTVIWDIAKSIGMQCVTQISIDETWSALRCRPIEMVGK